MPIWLFSFVESPATIWQVASILSATLLLWHISWVTILTRRSGPRRRFVNRQINALLLVLTGATGIAFFVNCFSTSFGPTFALYYLALLASLIVGFLAFADALVGPSSDE